MPPVLTFSFFPRLFCPVNLISKTATSSEGAEGMGSQEHKEADD